MTDPRITLARPDLADARLQGLAPAAAYARTAAMRCVLPAAAMRTAADEGSEQPNQLLFGEAFEVLETQGGWAWGQARRDGYVGHVRRAALSATPAEPTHRVRALRANAHIAPDLKAPSAGLFSLNSLVRVVNREDRFAQAVDAGWFVEAQLAPLGEVETDPAAVAELFLGAPYHWGARESDGVDCSGLVQQALHACGLACPRDTDQQLAVLGRPLEARDLRRGDLVFWTGHVGLMLDHERLLHASGDWAAVVAESLADAIARIRARGGGAPIAFRRL